MLKLIERYVLKLRFNYHHKVADYYFRKVDEYDNLNNLYLAAKIEKHVRKEGDILDRLIQLHGDLI